MAHNSSRNSSRNILLSTTIIPYENTLSDMNESTSAVQNIIEDLISNGAKILYMKYINSQIFPYASRTLAKELVLNATWASFPLDSNDITAESDDDLAMPIIDEWAGGVLPVRDPNASALRNSVTPQRDFRTRFSNTAQRPKHAKEGDVNKEKINVLLTGRSVSSVTAKKNTKITKEIIPKPKTPLTEAQIITRKFEEAKKKMNVTSKSVTVDSDFNVIQINEPKGLPPAIIVPKISTSTKRSSSSGNNQAKVLRMNNIITKPVVQRDQSKKKRKVQLKFLEQDYPLFDDEVADISYSDRFVCAPGVTLKDGSIVKSRPQIINSSQLTRSQYETYLENMKRGAE
ncbi:hypothetical protein TRFO_25843 [Tritrichomonas foetus]|uniref:Uncharacterized protein n=1 Tax=Tritrichomonas foetus TaxID=1144522 RepID=A0A1J4K9T6_9EUKA|nr:hypothetical protein TRFO_25843 [Tritrichomonas foetus]|eukprot:OHT06213.1 hypothetical protein TRFO_25843 [Tritrichomonas foetus]